MTVVKFEDLIKDGAEDHANHQPQQNGEPKVYQKWEINTMNLKSAHDLYRKTYVNKQRVASLLKQAIEVCDKAKEEVLKLTDYKEYENSDFKLSNVKRQGTVDWRRFEASNPNVRLEAYRNEDTYYWTIKLKVKE